MAHQLMKCIYCKFNEKRSTSKYCSEKCRNKYKQLTYTNKHSKEEIYGKAICFVCEKEYVLSRRNQKYCSLKCVGITKRKYLNIPNCLENSKRICTF